MHGEGEGAGDKELSMELDSETDLDLHSSRSGSLPKRCKMSLLLFLDTYCSFLFLFNDLLSTDLAAGCMPLFSERIIVVGWVEGGYE